MATELTPEQGKIIRSAQDLPVEMIDPQTEQSYVLLKTEFYDRIKHLLDLDEPTTAERRALLQKLGRSIGWEEPEADELI